MGTLSMIRCAFRLCVVPSFWITSTGVISSWHPQLFSSLLFPIHQIFEAEQANLHAEPLVAAKVLSTALALTCFHLAGTSTEICTADAVSKWVRSHAVTNLVDAMSLLRGSGAAHSDWVGGCTYQKEVFTYLSSALQSSLAIESLFREHKNFNTVCGEIPSQLFSTQPTDCDADVEGSRSHLRVISDGHPIIKRAYEEFCAIVI